MAVVTLIHWVLPERWRGGWIILCTALFLAAYSLPSLAVLSIMTFILYGLAGRRDHISGKELVFIIGAIGALFSFFKIRATMAGVNIDMGAGNGALENFIIPLGLSYYTFRCIHYAIEKYKHAIPAHGFYNLAQYLFFLPTLTAGPIHRYPDFDRDLRRKRWNPYLFAEGIERMIYGYVKISFFANFLVSYVFAVQVVEITAANESLGFYLMMLQMGMNLYFLFAGYSDIAIGFGMLLGYRVIENFNWPFLARNVSDFWRRWHISLTSWCRDYVYMGTISVTRQAWLAALAAMLVMGLWHEFSLRYIIWGLYQGAGIVIWQKFQNIKPWLPQIRGRPLLVFFRIFSTLLTLHYVLVGMMLVHHGTLGEAIDFLETIFLFWR